MRKPTQIEIVAKAFTAALAIILGLVIIAALGLTSNRAKAHSWYPSECCGGNDCAPALEARVVPEGLIVRTIHGVVMIPASYEYRQSKDGRIHACMQKENGEAKLLCAFRPPMM